MEADSQCHSMRLVLGNAVVHDHKKLINLPPILQISSYAVLTCISNPFHLSFHCCRRCAFLAFIVLLLFNTQKPSRVESRVKLRREANENADSLDVHPACTLRLKNRLT